MTEVVQKAESVYLISELWSPYPIPQGLLNIYMDSTKIFHSNILSIYYTEKDHYKY